jgi:hypothetical protein
MDIILFLEDWNKHPLAIADVSTDNRSFVEIARLYKEMGIKNHVFMLALHNPLLKGVSPRDPNLTLGQMMLIADECSENPFYYFREVARVPAQSGSPEGPFRANRANVALFWCFFNHCWFILIQPRQTGKSFSTDNLMVLLLNIICRKTSINLMTKDDILRRANIERIKDIMDALPPYLQQKSGADANNGEEITIRSLGNVYKTHLPQMSEKRALIVGRGLTTAISHFDEPPFQPNIATSLPASLGGTGAAQDAAKAAGAPYGTIMTTTAGKRDDRDGKYIYKLLTDAAEWTELFLDARNHAEFERMVRINSRTQDFMINGTFNHRQLGYTDQWLLEKIKNAKAEGDDANRDFMNIWTSGSLTSPFDQDTATKISRSTRLHDHIDMSAADLYVTRWYIPREKIGETLRNGKFIMSLDTSEASGGDDIALMITDIETLNLIAIGNFNETNLFRFSEWICDILIANVNVTAIIERRSTGAMLIDLLCIRLPEKGIDPFRRLYNRVVNDSDEFPERFREIQQPMNRRSPEIYTKFKKTFGFSTSGSGATSRTELYSTTLQNAAKQAGDRMFDKALIEQVLGLVTRNGRIDHEVGQHDDLVIAWLLTHWMLTQGKNLSFYGIDSRRIRIHLKKPTNETREEAYARHEQELINIEIDDLYQQLVKEPDDAVSMRLEMQIRTLDRRRTIGETDVNSVDELLRKVKDNKRTKRYSQETRSTGELENGGGYTQTEYRSERPLTHREAFQGYNSYGR